MWVIVPRILRMLGPLMTTMPNEAILPALASARRPSSSLMTSSWSLPRGCWPASASFTSDIKILRGDALHRNAVGVIIIHHAKFPQQSFFGQIHGGNSRPRMRHRGERNPIAHHLHYRSGGDARKQALEKSTTVHGAHAALS